MPVSIKFQCNQCGNRFIDTVDDSALQTGAPAAAPGDAAPAPAHKCPACDSTNVEMRVRR